MARWTTLPLALFILAPALPLAAQEPIELRDALVIPSVGRYGRSAVVVDYLEAERLAGTWKAPVAGDTVRLAGGRTRAWKAIKAADDGWINDRALRGGYAYMSVESGERRVMILEASGHSMVYVNGEPRAGDPYRTGWTRLPVLLAAGTNGLLFHCGRGGVRARLVAPAREIYLSAHDATLPHLVVGEKADPWGAVMLINASTETVDGISVDAAGTDTPLAAIPPLSIRKIAFRIGGGAAEEPGTREVALKLKRKGKALHEISINLGAVNPGQSRRRTFVSNIDGSVQYYAVRPARPLKGRTDPPALFLTLHGAGVEATGQANSYAAKSWGHIVAATNRRPYGFDWEDWGRLDAMEVLEHAQKELKTDPRRTYLTGHSMGGHGVWHLGVTFPDRFAAIGPSAGWGSFWSYGGKRRTEGSSAVEALLSRATSPSDTLALLRNTRHYGVYILHGANDDNVPVRQARTLKKSLEGFHRDFVYHEQPGAGHWWDDSDEPGTGCVDWAPMFDFFSRRTVPSNESVRDIEFLTANPGVSAWSYWLGIEAQIRPLQVSSVTIRCDPGKRRFVGTTDNVSRLALDPVPLTPDAPVTVQLDEQKIESIAWAKRIWLSLDEGEWSVMERPAASLKGPHRNGPFKEAFRNRVLLVYGTRGSKEENEWAFAKARYDAETFWYRGNARVQTISDTAFDPEAEPDRNVVLYGNAETNAAWKALLGESPVQVDAGRITIGKRELPGEDLACLLIRPRPGSDRALVGAVGGSGAAGMRLTTRLPYFVSGVGYPDCIVIGPEMLKQGNSGVRFAGFFGADWSLPAGEFARRKE